MSNDVICTRQLCFTHVFIESDWVDILLFFINLFHIISKTWLLFFFPVCNGELDSWKEYDIIQFTQILTF